MFLWLLINFFSHFVKFFTWKYLSGNLWIQLDIQHWYAFYFQTTNFGVTMKYVIKLLVPALYLAYLVGLNDYISC
jgi:hypothetical protein